jgi:uncharacterized protein (TIGR03032 family)
MTEYRSPATPDAGNPAALVAQQEQAPSPTAISASRGLYTWLTANRTSFAFSSYQSGLVMLVGAGADGNVSVHQQGFTRAMGLWWSPNRLHLASRVQLWRLENILAPGQLAQGQFDVSLMPRETYITGDIDVHEIAVDGAGRLIFVNTGYSCLATLDSTHSFRPIWKPSFISELVREDRCHLNGLAMADGKPKYVTAVSQTDVAAGWHGRPLPKGVVIDVETDRVVTDGLSMPHSPRVADGKLYALDSGRGFLVGVDPATGTVTDIAFCPGFLRGLSIHGKYALVTVSKPRYGTFETLPLGAEMELRRGTPMCGVLIIDLTTGEIVEWLKLEGGVQELFTVALMPGVRCPMSIGPGTPEFPDTITFDPKISPFQG